MEGNGGMVAVVQGLQDAGLAVTLLSQRCQPSGKSVLAGLVGLSSPAQACQTVVNSATETVLRDRHRDTLYRSSYQLAHCQPSGLSPARLPQYSLQGLQQYRSSTSRSPDEEAFVESLRKYPISPVRSRSADLIERMLSYTQSKNGSRSPNTRSAKSLPSKEASIHLNSDEIPTRDTGIATNGLRPNYGYKRDVELIPVPTNKRKSRYDKQVGMYDYLKSSHKDKKLKGSEVRYLTNVKQCIRERLRQICDEDPATICPKIQNRYSQHRRQYHTTESSQKSQKINFCKKVDKCPDCTETMDQDNLQRDIQISPSTSGEQKHSRAQRSLSSFKHSKACFCDRALPCDCGTQPSRSILKPKITPNLVASEVNKRKQCIAVCEHDCNRAEDFIHRKLRKIILKWLQELPVHANFSANDALAREEVINKLIDTLGHFENGKTYFQNVENEVKNCLKILPMWRPENKADQESFENQLAFSLIQKIKCVVSEKNDLKDEILKWIESIPFTHNNIDKEKIVSELIEKLKPLTPNQSVSDKNYKEALKTEIINTLDRLPIEFAGSKPTAINSIADKLVEKLETMLLEQTPGFTQPDIKDRVLDWIKHIPQIADDIHLNKDDYDLVNELITKLNDVQNQNADNKLEQMNQEITNWLNSVEEKKKCQIDWNTKNMLTGKLIEKLIESQQEHQLQKNLNDLVQKWFENMPHMSGINFVDNQRDLEILTMKLQDIQTIENYENRQNTMRQEILKWLQNFQKKHGRNIDSGISENLVNILLNMIKDESDVQKNLVENSLITQKIWKWLESQPQFKHDNSLQYRDMVIELSEKLQDIKDKTGELTEHNVKAEVTKWFEKLSQDRGIHIEPSNREKLQDKLLSSIGILKRRKNWKKPYNIPENVSKEVSDIINNSVIPLEDNELKLLKDRIIQHLIQDLSIIHSKPTNEPLKKIRSLLKQATNLSETKITTLAQTLIEKVKEATLSNLSDITQETPLIDVISKDKLKSKVEDILKLLPLRDKQRVIDKVTDTLVKNCEEMKTDNDFDEIYEILKEANINENEAQRVTNNLLEIINQFRNEFTDSTYKSPSYGSGESLWIQKQIFMQRLEREITDFMEKVLNESSSFNKDTTSGGRFISEPLEDSTNQYNRFKIPPFKTSTPTKSDSRPDMNVENQYKNQIKDIIKQWITCLKIDHVVDDLFKDEMAHDIAADIMDRQRYIQLSKMKRSSQDEMEHLKYQVFKWTSKLPNQIDLTTKIDEIQNLIRSVEAVGIPNLIRETNKIKKKHGKSLMETNGNIIMQDACEYIEENIYDAIWKWFNEISNLKPRSSADKHMIDDIIANLSKKLKNLLSLDPHTKASNWDSLCKEEIVKCLMKLKQHLENSEELLEHRASEVMNYLKSLEFLEQTQVISEEAANRLQKKNAIKAAVQNWCQKLPLKPGKTFDDMKDTVENLAEAVSQYLLITDMENLNTFMNDILNNLKKLPLQFDKDDSKHLPEFTDRLIETLKGVLNDSEKYNSSSQHDYAIRKPAFKKAAEVMYDNIQKWCENLPLDLAMTSEGEIDQVNIMKQNLAGKLLKKVGELNLDPEIFHDDYLYEDVLKDEIEKILDSLPKTNQFHEILTTLKENLLKDLLEAKEGMKNEMAGFAYKQQLRDAISKTLSSIGLPISEEVPLQVLKDNLADAFISLHYVADDENLKKKFKDKIFNAVNKFCDDYLKQNPASPLNANQLNEELYKALKKVPVPKDESMRREVEQIRVKDIITDWFKDLPFEEIPSQVQENKIISILAKRLHEIENEAELNPDMNVDEIMNNEISKWLKKIKLKSEGELSTEPVKKNLVNKLKATKNSRKYNESTFRKSISYEDLTTGLNNSPEYPPSNLSAEDRAHLQRIKDRTSIERTILKPDDRRDASISPAPTETGMQTEEKRVPDNYIYQKVSHNASIQTIIREPEPPTSITPQVIVKEYYWNSQGSPVEEQRSGSILSYMQSPVAHLPGNIHQKANIVSQEIPHVTTASQTTPLPESKSTLTQEASIVQIIKSRIHHDDIGNATKSPCLTRGTTAAQQQLSNEINIESQAGQYNPDDYLQLNLKKNTEMKPCQPCRGRAVLSGELGSGPEAGTSKAFQENRREMLGQNTKERTEFHGHNPEYWSPGNINRNCLDDQEFNQPCFRRSVYQTPMKDVECHPKRKRRGQQPCTCRSPLLTKCTIRPQSPCQHSSHSNKSCYVSKKHCPKCWDGFCPHPSYLYFRQD